MSEHSAAQGAFSLVLSMFSYLNTTTSLSIRHKHVRQRIPVQLHDV